MPSKNLTCVGKGEFLPSLRKDLKAAKHSLWLICPWVDEFFSAEVCKAASASLIEVKLITRPATAVEKSVWMHMRTAIENLDGHFKNFYAFTLESLHAKVIVIDQNLAYVGSTNFYRYSLERSHEIAVRGAANQMEGLHIEIESLFEDSTCLQIARKGKAIPSDGIGIQEEIDDPLIKKILDENPGAWVLGRRSK